MIVVSIDGGRADWLSTYAADSTMPTLGRLIEGGAWSTLQGVDPAISVVAHNSLACGCMPAHSGVVAGRVHRPQDSFYWYTSGFDLPVDPAEPIWQAASRAGLSSAALFWPGATMAIPDQMADYTVGYGDWVAPSAVHELTFRPAQGWVDSPPSLSPLMESQFEIVGQDGRLATVYVLAVDDSGNVGGPDLLVLSRDDRVVDAGDAELRAKAGEWAYWPFDPTQARGTDFLITSTSSDMIKLYQSSVYDLNAVPEALRLDLFEILGYFPPEPDYLALEQGWISDEQYLAMIERQSAWMMEVTLWVYSNYRPDLLFTLQSSLKQAGHQFLLVDERQPGYSVEQAERYRENLARAASGLDGVLAHLLSVVGPEIDQGEVMMLIVGSSGMAPIHTQVNVNTVLERSGLLRLDNRNYVVVGQSKAIAFTSGGTAQIYISLAGRERNGIVAQDAYQDVQDQIVETLSDLRDPVTGEPIFARILRRDELARLGLDGLYTGDVFAQANPGYSLSDWRGADTLFEPVTFYGQQGYDANLPSMQGGFLVVGQGIAADRPPGLVSLIDIAPTLANWLNFDAGPNTDGRPIAGLTFP